MWKALVLNLGYCWVNVLVLLWKIFGEWVNLQHILDHLQLNLWEFFYFVGCAKLVLEVFILKFDFVCKSYSWCFVVMIDNRTFPQTRNTECRSRLSIGFKLRLQILCLRHQTLTQETIMYLIMSTGIREEVETLHLSLVGKQRKECSFLWCCSNTTFVVLRIMFDNLVFMQKSFLQITADIIKITKNVIFTSTKLSENVNSFVQTSLVVEVKNVFNLRRTCCLFSEMRLLAHTQL